MDRPSPTPKDDDRNDLDSVLSGHRAALGRIAAQSVRLAIEPMLAGQAASKTSLGVFPHDHLSGLFELSPAAAEPPSPEGVFVGTLRMGYGHYRFGLAVADAAKSQGLKPYWLDLTALPSKASRILSHTNRLYSSLSRAASRAGGLPEWLWERFTSGGGWNALQASMTLAPAFTSLMADLDRSIPFVSTFVWAGHIAVRAGFERVVHLVNDNAPMPFIVVPGSLNLVQSPSMYASLRRLGVPADRIELAGHWVPQTMAESAQRVSDSRISRLESKKPRRFLLPIGGAGSQLELTKKVIAKLAPFVRAGEASLLINCGDHVAARRVLARTLEAHRIHWEEISDFEEARSVADELQLGVDTGKPAREARGAILFHFATPLLGVALTNTLVSACDVLVAKPSELAFLPVPKLMLRRVGKHEGAGAVRASELGDGTPECRTWEATEFFLDEMTKSSDLLLRLNERVAANSRLGIYDGCINAIKAAT
jgi:hypothetical protein